MFKTIKKWLYQKNVKQLCKKHEHDFLTLQIWNTNGRTSHVLCLRCGIEGFVHRRDGNFVQENKTKIVHYYEDMEIYKNEDNDKNLQM